MRVDLASGDYVDRVWLGPALLCERRGGNLEYMHRTLGGSVAAVSDEAGNILKQEEFFPYGNTMATWGSSAHEHGFHGLRRDEAYVTGPRPYDPDSGRWLARDPVAHDPRTWSTMRELDTYGYAYARPFEFHDPSGFQPAPTGELYVEGDVIPDDQYVDQYGRYMRLDPDIPVDVQLWQEDMKIRPEDIAYPIAAIGMVVIPVMEEVPVVGPAVKIAQGKTTEGLAWLAVDVLGGSVLKAGKWAYKGVKAARGARAASAGCFPAGTLVVGDTGTEAIEDVEIGDEVACSDAAGRWELCAVADRIAFTYDGDVITVVVAGEVLRATGDHPFWVRSGKDLDQRARPAHLADGEPTGTARGRWVTARELQAGDQVELADGRTAQIAKVSAQAEALEVFNIMVDRHHTFAVGDAGVLVHNKPMMTAVARAMQVAARAPSSTKVRYQCDAFAAAMKVGMRTVGVKGTTVTVRHPRLRVMSRMHGELAQRGQPHVFTVVGDTVFDNMNPRGIPYEQFADDIGLDDMVNAGATLVESSF